jgi:hypothetical protein
MTLRVPEDLPRLRKLAKTYGKAPAFVINEAGPEDDTDPEELPIVAVEVEEEGVYIELRTSVSTSKRSPRGALTFAAVLERLEKLSKGVPRELFWVSSLRPLADETKPELSGYRARHAMPLVAVAAADEPSGVAFVIHRAE